MPNETALTAAALQQIDEPASDMPLCPRCKAPVTDADFCESCGEWLLSGECRFCYALVPSNVVFCPECGCEQAGVTCTRCGMRGHFDFCTDCGSAVTEAAEQEQARLRSDPAVAALLQVDIDSLASVAPKLDVSPTDDVTSKDGSNPASGGRSTLFSSGARQAFRELHQGVDREAAQRVEDAQRIEEARRVEQAKRGEEAKRMEEAGRREQASRLEMAKHAAQMRDLKRKLIREAAEQSKKLTFTQQQEARRHHMALKEVFEGAGRRPRAWKCNRFHNEHESPNLCAAPQFGGEWLLDD